MNGGHEIQKMRSQSDLDSISNIIRVQAEKDRGDVLALLALLRLLEALHREIREGLFQECLPDNRQALYALLRDIEADGGWPYIHRMKLRSLLDLLTQESLTQNPLDSVKRTDETRLDG
jgi:hypothetical protein